MRARRLSAGVLALVLVVSAPGVAQQREARVTFVGDTGTGDDNQRAVRDQMLRFRASHAFLLGDNVYESGSSRSIPSRYDAVYAPVMRAGTVFHSALGNHDVKNCDAPSTDPLPATADAYAWRRSACYVEDHLRHAPFGYRGGLRYYSVLVPSPRDPLLEVFVLDSNTLNTTQSKLPRWREDRAQVDWLQRALAASPARWKVVVMHHPSHSPTTGAKYFLFVPFGGGRAREYRLDEQLGPIFRRHGVDAVIAAHNHFYARMVPQGGIRYFVSGGGGRRVYPFEAAPGYVATGGDFYHFLYVRVTDRVFEYYAIDSDGRSRDAGWFAKGDAGDRAFAPGTLPGQGPRPAGP